MQAHTHMGYGHQVPNNSQGYYGPTQHQHGSTYGHVYYPANQGGDGGNHTTMDIRNNGLNALNTFYYDTQRGLFDPKSYPQVESRLMAIQAGQLPLLSNGGMADYHTGGGSMSGGGPQVGAYASTAQYQLPGLDNLRTKSDLLAIDQIMEQAQATIYDRPNQMAAAGVAQVAQPDAYFPQSGIRYRHSVTPPRTQIPTSQYANATSASPATVATSQLNGESPPALTPTESTQSYTSARSPTSLQSNGARSPASTTTMYPTLPSTNSATIANDYFPSSIAPTSTLGAQFHDDDYRRMRGGRLQRARPSHVTQESNAHALQREMRNDNTDYMDTSSTDSTVVNSKNSRTFSSSFTNTLQPQARPELSDSMIDPALSDVSMVPLRPLSGELEERDIKANEVWVGIVRTIENLRDWIRHRVENGEYEGGDGDNSVRGHEEDGEIVGFDRSEGEKGEGGMEPNVNEPSHGLYPDLAKAEAIS